MKRLTRQIVGAACAVTGMSVGSAFASVQGALNALWQRAADPAGGITAQFEYRTEDLDVPPPDRLEALRREVAGAPADPRRLDLVRYESILADRWPPTRRRVWLTPGAMRLSEDMNQLNTDDLGKSFAPGDFPIHPTWDDVGILGDTGWRLGRQQLTIVDSQREGRSSYGTANEQSMVQRDLGLFLTGGLQVARVLYDMEPGEPTGPPDHVRIVAGRDVPGGPIEFTWTGRYDEQADALTIQTMKITKADPAPEQLGESWQFDDWVEDKSLGTRRATSVTEHGPDGRPKERWTWVATHPVEAAQVKRLARVPDLAAPDPIRGTPTFTAIQNRSGRDDVYSRVSDTRHATREVSRKPILQPAGVLGGASLRYIGWGSAITLIVLIVWRVCRGRTASS